MNPETTRKRTVGATFSKDANGVILKGEFVYDRERNFVVDDPAHPTGIVKSDYFEYLLGVDYTFFRKLDFNAQVFQQYILNPVGTLYRPDRASYVSIWFKTGFWDNHVEPEFFAVARIPRVGEDSDFMFRPKLNFKHKQPQYRPPSAPTSSAAIPPAVSANMRNRTGYSCT